MAIQVLVNNLQKAIEVKKEWIDLACYIVEMILKEHGLLNSEVSLVFVDDDYIRKLNRDYRGIDKPTDVLSFAMDEGEEMPECYVKILGDVIISLPTAKRQAEAYGHTCERELIFLVIHGTLHLLGYDHSDDKEREVMSKQEKEFLTLLFDRE